MSNVVVPMIYRQIINQVIQASRPDFDELGIEDAVLQELLRSWETKLAKARIADFSRDDRVGTLAREYPPRDVNLVLQERAALKKATLNEAKSVKAESNSTSPTKESSTENPADTEELNSDLDDDDDPLNNEEDDDDDEMVIALYEKVQRVKNKWKITLKDGIISVGGKEYAFSRCQGEFEW